MNPTLIFSLLSGAVADAVGRAKRTAFAYAAMAVLGLLGVIFLLIAAFIYIARRYGELETALGFGGGFILLALIVLISMKISTRSASRLSRRRRNADLKAAAGAVALAALPSLVSRKAGLSSLIIPAAALVAFTIYRETRGPAPGDD